MRFTLTILTLTSLCFFFAPQSVAADSASPKYYQIYELYMELGKQAIDEKDYANAFNYFKHAQLLSPDSEEPLMYINLLKRLQENRIHAVNTDQDIGNVSKNPDRKGMVTNALDMYEQTNKTNISVVPPKPAAIVGEFQPRKIVIPKATKIDTTPKTVYLNDELWNTQPDTHLNIELNKSIMFEGNNIKRFLVVASDFIDGQTIDRDRILVTAKRLGSTFVHIWDEQGRWTLHMEIILPVYKQKGHKPRDMLESHVDPFIFSYSSNWSSFNQGPNLRNLDRESLDFIQRVGLQGETPYGQLDTSATIQKFGETTKVTSYTLGLTEGHIGPLKNFHARGFDFKSNFSSLTLSEQTLRGILFHSRAFDQMIEFTYVHGRDRGISPTLTAGSTKKRDAFIEGLRVVLFPTKENHYVVNFARGYGRDRSASLKDRVASFESHNRYKNILFTTESGFDEQKISQIYNAEWKKNNTHWNIKLRNIDKDFKTISSSPGNRGEIGGNIRLGWDYKKLRISSGLDLYRDRLFKNADNPNAVNTEFSTHVNMPLNDHDNWNAGLFFINTPQEISPRQNLNMQTGYVKRFEWSNNRFLTTNIRTAYQRSRFDQTPASDYDRLSLSGDIRWPIFKNFNYNVGYEYSWVDEKFSGNKLKPKVFYTGIDWSHRINNELSTTLRYAYRDEEDTEGTNSFLSGEDSAIGSLSLSYRPSNDLEFFFTGRVRNVWAESANRDAFDEVDFRLGMRSNWNLPLSWSPVGIIEGYVFKDLNGNQKLDTTESGIEGITVNVGHRKLITNTQGYYYTKVRAKTVKVGVDVNSIPEGFVFSTPALIDVKIAPHRRKKVSHGLNIHSGIYGVAYLDTNKNNKPDAGDEFVRGVKIFLDEEELAVSDFEGTYFFRNITTGQHNLRIDVNSIPLEYIPTLQLKKEVNISEGTTYVFHVPVRRSEARNK